MLDADDFVELSDINEALDDTNTGYKIQIKHQNLVHYRTHIFNSKYNWSYKCPVHEYPVCDINKPLPVLPNFIINARCEGNRSLSGNKKYLLDAYMLKEELNNENCDIGRTLFYLAQSYRDAKLNAEALVYYKTREQYEGFYQENYISCLNIIRLSPLFEEKLKYAWKAQNYYKRPEVPYEMLIYCRRNNIFNEEIYLMGKTYMTSVILPDSLFAEKDAYSWKYKDELSIHAFYNEDYDNTIKLAESILNECNEENKERILLNIKLSKDNIRK